jgi:hypothetical protein
LNRTVPTRAAVPEAGFTSAAALAGALGAAATEAWAAGVVLTDAVGWVPCPGALAAVELAWSQPTAAARRAAGRRPRNFRNRLRVFISLPFLW